MKTEVTRKGNDGVLVVGDSAYTFEISSRSRSEIEQHYNQNFNDDTWDDLAIHFDGMKVFQFGRDNNLPIEIRDTVGGNHLLPRIFTKRGFLTWGKGPRLYKETFEEGKIRYEFVEDNQIQDWLESFGHVDYLLKIITDFNHLELAWSKVHLRKEARLNGGRYPIGSIEHVPAEKVREATKDINSDIATHGVVGDWNRMWKRNFRAFPLKDWKKPTSQKTALHCHKNPSFATDHHTRPDIMGLLPWLRRSSAIPYILEALSNNSLNIKWHIISPAAYWEKIKEGLEEKCAIEGIEYEDKMLEDAKDKKFADLAKVLAGERNVGKFFTSEMVVEVLGTTIIEHKWEIIPIDQKVGDYVKAQLEIAKAANMATVAGGGLHQALSNVAADGKSDSGSEQLYAMQNYILTEVDVPELIICQAINKAIKVNWPTSNIKLGFYRSLPVREEDKTPKDRVKNA